MRYSGYAWRRVGYQSLRLLRLVRCMSEVDMVIRVSCSCWLALMIRFGRPAGGISTTAVPSNEAELRDGAGTRTGYLTSGCSLLESLSAR